MGRGRIHRPVLLSEFLAGEGSDGGASRAGLRRENRGRRRVLAEAPDHA